MEQEPKPEKSQSGRTRLALQLPRDINEYFARAAQNKLTSKSAMIRAALQEYMRSHPENQA